MNAVGTAEFERLRAMAPPPKARSRYAPSPSGPLHLGNLRTALLAWLQARLAGADFIMRMEDLDQPRMKAGCDEAMLEALIWLGLTWDFGPGKDARDIYYQSQRTAIYESALAYLQQKGLVYRCYCSRKDIIQAASAPHGNQGMPPYPGTCRDLSPDQEAAIAKAKPDRQPAWRFKVADRDISFVDRITGHFTQHLQRDVGDFVVKRSDGLFAYQLAVVVDDGLMGISDVLRGEDLLDSTPRQIALFEALGFRTPTFWHVPLVCDEDGNRLAKRDGASGLAPLRAAGVSPERIIGALAASLGWVEIGQSISANRLLASLNLEKFRANLHLPQVPIGRWRHFDV